MNPETQYQVGSYPVGNTEDRNDPIFDNELTALHHATALTEDDETAIIGIWELHDGDTTLQYLVCVDGVFVYS